MTQLPWNHQNTEFSLWKSPLFCSDRRKFLFFRWNLEPVTPPSQASLILRESRNGKRKSLSFLAISGSIFCCTLSHLLTDYGPRGRQLRESATEVALKSFCLTGKRLLLCLIQMWNTRLLYLLSSSRTGLHTTKMWKKLELCGHELCSSLDQDPLKDPFTTELHWQWPFMSSEKSWPFQAEWKMALHALKGFWWICSVCSTDVSIKTPCAVPKGLTDVLLLLLGRLGKPWEIPALTKLCRSTLLQWKNSTPAGIRR